MFCWQTIPQTQVPLPTKTVAQVTEDTAACVRSHDELFTKEALFTGGVIKCYQKRLLNSFLIPDGTFANFIAKLGILTFWDELQMATRGTAVCFALFIPEGLVR